MGSRADPSFRPPQFLEEAYEAAEAFDRDDPALMCEELGDMLMQVLFNIHIEEDAGRFTTDDVTDHICKSSSSATPMFSEPLPLTPARRSS